MNLKKVIVWVLGNMNPTASCRYSELYFVTLKFGRGSAKDVTPTDFGAAGGGVDVTLAIDLSLVAW